MKKVVQYIQNGYIHNASYALMEEIVYDMKRQQFVKYVCGLSFADRYQGVIGSRQVLFLIGGMLCPK